MVQKGISFTSNLTFYSAHPIHHNRNIVFNLRNRAFLLSDKKYYKKNRNIITDILLKKKKIYSLEFINKQIKARLRKIFYINSSQNVQSNDNKSIATITMPDCKNFHKILKLFEDYNIRVIPFLYRCLQSIISRSKNKTDTLD